LLFTTIALADTPQQRIVGGQEADPGEWPWQVALVRTGMDPGNGQFCGGTLIARDWVLTAAHCVDSNAPATRDVVSGIHDLVTPDPNFQRRGVAEVIIHPGWDPGPNDNDVALLRLASPIDARPGSGTTLPIAFAPRAASNIGDLAGVMTTVTGWGNRAANPPGGSDFPAALHEVEVPVITNAACNTAYGGSITDNMLCAGFDTGGKDSCQGDSGGPLVYDSGGGNWVLVGVVSFGIGCADADYPGVYARVSRYADWISSYVNPLVATDASYIPFITNVPPAPPPSPLINGNFEQGPGVGWAENSLKGYPIILNDFNNNQLTPHSGQWLAWLGGVLDDVRILSQTAVVPAGQSVLSYYYLIGSADACGYDMARVRVAGALIDEFTLCAPQEVTNWTRRAYDLSAYAGQSVLIEFEVTTDGSLNSNWFIDDVSFGATLVGPAEGGPTSERGGVLSAPME
jgi:hypothetical protein